jgi:serine/threonine-protein kinase
MSTANEWELDNVLHALEEDARVELSAEQRAHVIGGRYEVMEELGAGGTGRVLLVRHQRLGKLFALKLMQADFSRHPESEQLFHREAQLASQLSHPNIVDIVDFGHDADWGWFIVMEYIKGELLSTYIAKGHLPVAVVCDVAEQLADALRHSHSKGVVHADVKSDNVLVVTPEGEEGGQRWQVKLLDFGTAQFGTEHAAASAPAKFITGTPEYIAPERAMGGPAQPASDIYAVGIIMYEMLTGNPPFTGETASVLERHLTEVPAPAGALRGEVLDERLDAILEKALAKDPQQRHAGADELLAELRSYTDALGLQRPAGVVSPGTMFRPSERVEAAIGAFDELRLPVAGLRRDGVIVVANAAFARLLGAEPDAIVGRNARSTFLEHVNPDLHDDLRVVALNGRILRRDLAIERGGRSSTVRYVLSPASGACGHCLLVLYPL